MVDLEVKAEKVGDNWVVYVGKMQVALTDSEYESEGLVKYYERRVKEGKYNRDNA